MPISITDPQGLLEPPLRALIERRLLFALSRFDSRIKRVQVVIGDQMGPGCAMDTDGIEKVCRVSVSLQRAEDVLVRMGDANWDSCLSRVAERVGRAVARSIERSNSQRGIT